MKNLANIFVLKLELGRFFASVEKIYLTFIFSMNNVFIFQNKQTKKLQQLDKKVASINIIN